jgi:multimeric flavodoxin WrbA
MKNKKVIIVGTSRNNGNTTKIAAGIANQYAIDVINLNDYQFSYYDYEGKNKDDDFQPLIKSIIEKYDTIIFATPNYWYNMSGIMKVFFDRCTDIILIEKESGKSLKGKKCGVISNSHEDELESDFYIPFRKSAEYLGMEYIGNAHFNADKFNPKDKIELAFI